MIHRETIATAAFVTVMAITASAPSPATAQVPDTSRVCSSSDFWATCAKKVKAAISKTDDPKLVLAAATEWSERYNALYRAHQQRGWSASDQERLELAMEKLWDEGVGQYLDPAGLALALALKRFLPSIAAAVEWASAPQVVMLYALLAPSPIANAFTEARPVNAEINALLASKLPHATRQTIRTRYPELFRKAFEQARPGAKLP